MASDELKEMRKNLTKEAIREHQMAKTGGTQTDLFTCGKCKKKNCTYTQVRLIIFINIFLLNLFNPHSETAICLFRRVTSNRFHKVLQMNQNKF